MLHSDTEPVLHSLPWRTSGRAESWLGEEDRRTLSGLRAITVDASVPNVLDAVAEQVGRYLRAACALVIVESMDRKAVFVGKSERSVKGDVGVGAAVRELETFMPGRADSLSNRPVNTATLRAWFPERSEGAAALRHIGLAYHLRAAAWSGEAPIGHVVAWRRAVEGGFDMVDHARLAAALPQLARLMQAHRAVRTGNGIGVTRALDAFDQPAFLLLECAVAHTNPSARMSYPALPDWLRSMGTNPEALGAVATITRMDIDSSDFALVIPRCAACRCSALDTLSPPLRRVAELLGEGWSDKEIALMTNQPLATVRTYVTRVMAKLGVRSRGQITRMMRRS